MALKLCRECRHEVSSLADKCPNCGAPVKRRMGCLGLIVVLVVLFFLVAGLERLFRPRGGSRQDSRPRPALKMGEPASAGSISYTVWGAWWSDRLSKNPLLNRKPNASYLFVELSVRNDDTKTRMIPPFKLVDARGAEHEDLSRTRGVVGWIGSLEGLNPGVAKRGVIVFDVPQDRTYKLKVSGGYLSKEDGLIELDQVGPAPKD